MMKKIICLYAVIFSISVLFCGCKRNQIQNVPDEDVDKPMTTTTKDTAAVMELVNEYIGYLRDKRPDDALAMLKYLNESGVITSLPEDMSKNQRNAIKFFLGKEYKIEDLTFYKENDSQVIVSCKLFEKEEGDPTPNLMSFKIRPMRINGKWYITLADSMTDTVESKIDN